jgi:hypothetical protein
MAELRHRSPPRSLISAPGTLKSAGYIRLKILGNRCRRVLKPESPLSAKDAIQGENFRFEPSAR